MKIKFFVNIVNFEKTLKNRVDIKLQSEYNISIINEKQIKALTETKMFVD